MRFDIIYQHDSANRHGTGHLFHLENCIPGGVQAIVNKHLNLTGVLDHARETLPARPLDVRPPATARIGHRDPGLTVQPVIEREGKVYAPKVTLPVPEQRLQHDTGGDTVRDARLDHSSRLCVNGRAPSGAKQRPLSVAVPGVGVPAAVQATRRQQLLDIRHDLVQPLPVRARPRRAEQSVQVLVPCFVDLGGLILFPVPPPLRDFARQRTDHDERIANRLAQRCRHLVRRRPARFTPPNHNFPPRSQGQIISEQSPTVKLWSLR